MTPTRWIDRLVLETAAPRASLRLVVGLLGLAALLKGIDLWLELPTLLAVAREAPLLGGVVPPPPGSWGPLLAGIWLVASALLTLRLAPRPAAACLAVIGLWLVTSSAHTYSNHLYLLSLLSVLTTFLRVGGGGASTGSVPAWPARLMQIQLSLVYGFGALTKLNGSFLSGQLLGASSLLPTGLDRPAVLIPASALVVLLEAALALALWSRTLRPWAIAGGISLHVGILLVLPRDIDLVVFAITCLAVYPLFAATEAVGSRPGSAPARADAAPATFG